MPDNIPVLISRRPYATITDAFDHSDIVLAKTDGQLGSTNMSSIYTAIIQQVGRFAEDYASDVLYDIDNVKELIESDWRPEQAVSVTMPMGIREHGVDHLNFLLSRIKDTVRPFDPYVYPEHYYRKILALRIDLTPEENSADIKVKAELRDISHSLYKIDPKDLDEQGHLIIT